MFLRLDLYFWLPETRERSQTPINDDTSFLKGKVAGNLPRILWQN
jgi:hypothetical protein